MISSIFCRQKDVRNMGIFNDDSTGKPMPHHIYVDDDIIMNTHIHMPSSLAAATEAFFRIMGTPAGYPRQRVT